MARYIPILRFMRGERVGIQRLSQARRANVAPLFVLAPKQYVGKKATQKHPAIPAPDAIANELMTCWGTAPFFLDASALPAGAQHPIVDIAAAARNIGLAMIPAAPLASPLPYQHGVNSVVGTDHRGIGLRVDLTQVSSANLWSTQWPFPLPATDLIIDISDNAPMVATLGAAVTNVIQTLHQGASWRTRTIAGTSMPDNFSGLISGTHTIARSEWSIWQHLTAAGLLYSLDYGDYATVPTVPPPAGIKWGFPINVRYTLANQFLICRGVPTTGYGAVDMGPQLMGHAQSIVAHSGRGPLANCWGDTEIDGIANGAAPQGLEHWVQISVNRHLELVRNLLP